MFKLDYNVTKFNFYLYFLVMKYTMMKKRNI